MLKFVEELTSTLKQPVNTSQQSLPIFTTGISETWLEEYSHLSSPSSP